MAGLALDLVVADVDAGRAAATGHLAHPWVEHPGERDGVVQVINEFTLRMKATCCPLVVRDQQRLITADGEAAVLNARSQ